MNDAYLNDEDYSTVQSVEDIKRILSEAQTPGPNKYNFDNQVSTRNIRLACSDCCFYPIQARAIADAVAV